MNDLISREEAISAVGCAVFDYNHAAAELSRSVLLNLPAIDGQLMQHARWISVNEQLPEKYQRVLAYSPSMSESDIGPISIQRGFICARKYSCITHWMLLPEPPKEEKQ